MSYLGPKPIFLETTIGSLQVGELFVTEPIALTFFTKGWEQTFDYYIQVRCPGAISPELAAARAYRVVFPPVHPPEPRACSMCLRFPCVCAREDPGIMGAFNKYAEPTQQTERVIEALSTAAKDILTRGHAFIQIPAQGSNQNFRIADSDDGREIFASRTAAALAEFLVGDITTRLKLAHKSEDPLF